MTEANTGSNQGGSQGGQAPSAGAQPTNQQPTNPRATGHSPARDARAAAGGQQAEQTFEIDGVKYEGQSVRDALKAAAEQDVRRRALPADPGGYKIELPQNFKPPEGMAFEFDANDPGLAQLRQIAHARGLDQATVSDLLGTYAGTKIKELQTVDAARQAEVGKLGGAHPQRLAAIEQWLKATAGDKAAVMIAQMKQYPVASTVEMFEAIIRNHSNQGGAQFSQSGRVQPDQHAIPGYDGMSFTQKRAAQDALNSRGNGPRR